MVATGVTVEGQVIKELPLTYQKVAVTSVIPQFLWIIVYVIPLDNCVIVIV